MLLSGLFAFYLSLYFLRLHEYRPETAQTSILFVTLLACLAIYLFKKEKNLNVIQTPFLLGFIIAAILSHVSMFYMQGAINTADELVRLAALYFISCALFVDKERLEFYFKLMAVCALVMTMHGIHQFHFGGTGWTGIKLYRGEQVRYLGVFNDPNDMGMLLVIAVPMILYLLNKSKNFILKFYWILVLATILYGIYLTGSRGTLLGLLAIMFIYVFLRMSKAFAIASFVIILPVAFALTQLSTISSDDASSAGRIDAWGEGIQMLKSNPVFGVGHGLFKDHHHIAAHSSYVEVFSETGLVGYFFWLGFVSMSLYGLYRFSFKFSLPDQDTVSAVDAKKLADYKSLSTALVFSLVAFMVTAFFISRSMQPLLFILCAMSAGLFFQIRQHYPDFMQLTFSSTFRICMFSTLLSVLFVYITIRLFW
jgi:O-antigen ligase